MTQHGCWLRKLYGRLYCEACPAVLSDVVAIRKTLRHIRERALRFSNALSLGSHRAKLAFFRLPMFNLVQVVKLRV